MPSGVGQWHVLLSPRGRVRAMGGPRLLGWRVRSRDSWYVVVDPEAWLILLLSRDCAFELARHLGDAHSDCWEMADGIRQDAALMAPIGVGVSEARVLDMQGWRSPIWHFACLRADDVSRVRRWRGRGPDWLAVNGNHAMPLMLDRTSVEMVVQCIPDQGASRHLVQLGTELKAWLASGNRGS